jgi:hypothetical protein
LENASALFLIHKSDLKMLTYSILSKTHLLWISGATTQTLKTHMAKVYVIVGEISTRKSTISPVKKHHPEKRVI